MINTILAGAVIAIGVIFVALIITLIVGVMKSNYDDLFDE
jgi:hypothetical protein